MRCPKCQFDNREGAKFCKKCGNKLEVICPSCGHAYEPDSLFCDECGYDLRSPGETAPIDYSQPDSYTPKHLADKILTVRSSMEGERKVVTVMFTDVVDYTSMSEKLDPEEVHQIMDGVFKILMDEIHRYEGTINQFTGDGVMALFGAPVAHEDHAQRACYSALAIQKALGQYGDKIEKDTGIAFKMRVGLNSGPVMVGAIGDDLRMDYTAVGDTTNLASRMEGMARPGSIMLSKNTQRLVKGYFELRFLGRLKVKGKDEPQEVFELLKAGRAETRLEAAAARGFTKFVGRKNSMASLMDAYERAEAGSGKVVGMVGEAGVGKSRLLWEFRSRLAQDKVTYLEGRCLHYGASMPYLPILDILRSYFELREEDREFVLQKKLKQGLLQLDENLKSDLPSFQDLLSLPVENREYLNLEPKEKKERNFEAIRNLLIQEGRKKTVIVAIEDLHWIDTTSEEFLNYFIGFLTHSRILLILLYRPEYTHQWAGKSYYDHIGLDQLTLKSSAELVQGILEGGEIVPELKDLILQRAAGNPLFMEELTHALLENGVIEQRDRQYVLNRRPSQIQVPDTIQGIIAARIDRLDETLKQIMQVASVIGREFAFRILQAITEMKEGLKSHLLNLQGLEFIHEKSLFPELEYIFKHAITQEVAYNSLLHKRRREIHGKIGRAIEQIYPERLEEFYEILAYHYSKSDNLKKAASYLKLAGQKAMGRFSPAEAFRFYKEAMATLDQMEDTDQNKKERIETLVSMGFPLRELAFPEDSFAFLQEGETLCKECKDQRNLAILYSHMGGFYSAKGNAAMGMKYMLDAFGEAERLQDSQITARIGASLSFSLDVAGEYRKVVRITPRILALVEKTGIQAALLGMPVNLPSLLYANYGHGLGYVGEFLEGQQACETAWSLAQETGNPYSIAIVEFLYGCFFIPKGDGENSVNHMEISIGYLEKLNAVFHLPLALGLLGEGYRLTGEFRKALGFMEKGLNLLMQIGMPVWLSLYHYHMSLIHFDLNNLNEAKHHAEQGVYFGQKNGERYGQGQSLLQLGRTLGKMESPATKKAEEHILQGLKILDELETKPAYAVGCLNLGELYLDAGLKEKALVNLKKAEEMFRKMGMDYWLGKVRESLTAL
ncbi:MAG: adenylate/guanylate cyclase domain-containing protein [Desulfatiglandaceae bacterium]